MKTVNKAIPWVLLGVGILMVAIGIHRQESAIVLQKAITVCLECIGIG